MQASSSNTGFFQQLPEVKNQFYDDVSFQRVLTFFVPAAIRREVEPDLAQIGHDVLTPRIFDLVSDAERNTAFVRGSGRNAVGQPTSELVTGAGWRGLQDFGKERGFVAYNYTTDYGATSRLLQMLRFHLWEASAACTTCPGAMTDGATRLLQRHLEAPVSGDDDALAATQRQVLQRAYDHLTSRDPASAWTSGQWMTERAGGSDVSQTETVARWVGPDAGGQDADGQPLGPWALDGFKWFSSATDANMTILLARTRPDAGLSAFYAPMRRKTTTTAAGGTGGTGNTDTELNGVRIQRLKDKFGTRPVPTAELELSGMRAWLIGQEGRGVRELATVLAITRVHCSINCLGLAGRALGVAKAYARVRCIGAGDGGKRRRPLDQNPLHMHTLATVTTTYHGLMLLTMYTALVMGAEERGGKTETKAKEGQNNNGSALPLLRALSSLHKAYVCKQAVPLLHAAGMEALGGIGYLLNSETEPLNVARLFRDACVNAIWEGTTDVLSTDLVRTLRGRAGAASLDAMEWVIVAAGKEKDGPLYTAWSTLRRRIESTDTALLLRDARDVLFAAAELLIGALLLADARRDGAPAAVAMCRRFLASKGWAEGTLGTEPTSVEALLRLDAQIVYGEGQPEAKL